MTLPARIVDCHHHFLAPSEPFHAFLKTLGAQPTDYATVLQLVSQAALETAGVDPRVNELIAESHTDTWLAIEGCEQVARCES